MPQRVITKNKKELRNNLNAIVAERIKNFSPDLQRIIVDDLITAFENRISVFDKYQTNRNPNRCEKLETMVIFDSDEDNNSKES